MILSAATTYGFRLLVRMAIKPQSKFINLATIARIEKLPLKYIEQIAHSLKNAFLLKSRRGREGGYALARNPRRISALEIFKALEGPVSSETDIKKEQVEILLFKRAFEAFEDVLNNTSLADLADKKLKNENKYVQMYYI